MHLNSYYLFNNTAFFIALVCQAASEGDTAWQTRAIKNAVSHRRCVFSIYDEDNGFYI